jgi:hypothetical protein
VACALAKLVKRNRHARGAPASPALRPFAVLALLLLTAVVLWIAARAMRRMEISYAAEG